jgi:Ca2+-transporting ATPase
VTITLALGVTRMVARHALIRRLPAVETLGSTTVICTDKTGTLTKNEMTVTRLYIDGRNFEVTGEGYEPKGEITEGTRHEARGSGQNPGLRELLTAAALCNDAELIQDESTWRVIGDPTEGALLVAAAKLQINKEHLDATCPLLGEVPFDAERKMMTVVRRMAAGPTAFVKGAPDVLLDRCTHYRTAEGRDEPLTDAARQAILAANHAFAMRALRVIGVARRRLPVEPAFYGAEDLERELTFVGLAAMKDPLRPEALAAVKACHEAGIRVVMITGDHRDTADAIANELGLLGEGRRSCSGAELDDATDETLAGQVETHTVYARVSAEHKLRIVRAWKARGAIVAMTGDGVNDAPAVKEADIGVAMGLTGTDVTKEASDMVVTDDNFASIAAAVEEGRAVYDNIRKTIHYLLSCNVSEVLLMLFAALLALPLPLLPVQILWINLITDGLPALALAVDPKSPDLMRRRPRSPQEPFLTAGRMRLLFAQGLFIALITLGVFAYCLYGMDQDLQRARALTFTVMVFAQLFHAFNCRSDRRSLFVLGVGTNKPLVWAAAGSALLQATIVLHPWARNIFNVTTFDPEHWALAMGLGLLPLLAMEGWKAVRR